MESAFTLLELLVTLTIVAALTAIAVPRYHHFRQRAFDVRAQSDLRNAALAEESYFLENEKYLSCEGDDCLEMPGLGRISKGVDLKMTALDSSFEGEAEHPKGTGKKFRWDSEHGGLAEE